MYPRYSIFDDVNFQVENGAVRLNGVVTQPFKKSDIDKIVRNVAGANQVQDLSLIHIWKRWITYRRAWRW